MHTIRYVIPIVVRCALCYIWHNTSPATIGPVGMLVVFVLLYIFWVSVLFIVLYASRGLFSRESLKWMIGRRGSSMLKGQQSYYVASIVAFVPVLLLAMQSVNQLTVRDILLVILFVSLAIFYVIKRS